MTRGALGARFGTIVAVIARISVAEIDGQRQFEVAPQLRLALRPGVDLAQPVGRRDLEAGKYIAPRVGNDNPPRLGGNESSEPLQKLAAGRMSEQGIGERPALLLAGPIDQR